MDPASGDLVRSLTRDVEPRPLLDADWEALPEVRTLRAHEQQSTGPLRGRGGVPCPLDGMRPDVFPVIRALFADEVGRLWVEAVTREGTVLAAHAPDGRLVGETAMPLRDERVRPFVRDGLLYLVTVDALGVQSVEVHRVVGLEP